MMDLVENNRIEFKERLTDDFEKEIVAFLNYNEGGVVYIGIDKNGNAVGVDNCDEVQLKIKDKLMSNISPSAMGLFDIACEEISGKTVLKITLASGVEKPYYIKRKGMSESGCFIRIGNSSHPMTKSMIEDLFIRRVRKSIANIESKRQDLTFRQLKICYEERGMPLNDNFPKTLDLLTGSGKFNYDAFLLADENSASIRVAKYWGEDKADLRENEEYGYCSLIKSVQSVLDKFELENITRSEITSGQRIDSPLVDKVALREAIINAFVHNDYSSEDTPLFEIFSDKFVITSYGGLIDGLSREEFFGGISKPRNRELMRIFKDLGYVEHLGSGMTRIMRKYDRSIFEFTDHYLRVSFTFGQIKGKEKSKEKGKEKSKEKILKLMGENPDITTGEIASILQLGSSTIEKHIRELKAKNKIKRVGADKGGHWKIL